MLGSGSFLPGFEDQLIGASAGEHRTVRVTFPEDYVVPDLAGKEATFEIDVKEVRHRAPIAIDDELGKAVGLESLAELRQEVQQQMQRDYDVASRLRLKRALLDKLAERYDFPVPAGHGRPRIRQHLGAVPGREGARTGSAGRGSGDGAAGGGGGRGGGCADALTKKAAPAAECEAAERAAASGRAKAKRVPAQESEHDAKARAEYRGIAERRVRLGLLLAEVGRANNISVSQDELNQAITREARRHPGYERQVLDYYRQNPDAIANLRAPIFEDKVVDFIVELAKLEERKVTPQELLALPDPDAEAAAPG